MKPGSNKSAWLQKLKEEGEIKNSKTLEEKPEVFSNMMWAWKAFDTMNRQRQVGQTGPQPIALHDMLAYCELARLVDDNREFLLDIIPEMDAIFLEDFHKKLNQKAKKSAKSKGK